MGDKKSMMILILALAVIIVGLGIVDILLYKKFAAIRNDKLPQAKKDLEEIKVLRGKLKELDAKMPEGAIFEVPTDILGFFEAHARKAGIPKEIIKSINAVKENTQRTGPWKEFSYAITISTGKDEKLSRSSLVDFLLNVERERPFLKTKDIIMQFTDDGSIERAQIYISYFKRS